MDKILSFKDLLAWQKAHELTVRIFIIFEKKNPNLRNQIERSSLSVTSNIAEGFGRSSLKDKTHFYVMARGSLFEVYSQLEVAKDTGLLSSEEYKELQELNMVSTKILHRLISSINTKPC